MKKIFLFFAFIAIFMGLFLAVRNKIAGEHEIHEISSGESEDNYVHELNIPIMEIDSLNPLATKNNQVQNILSLIYEPLVKISKNEKLESCLATEWAMKDDFSYIIKLRNTATWHNGDKFTADDVLFTINSLLNNSVASVYYDNVKNIKSIDKLDTYSIVITLNERDDFFMYNLTFPIVPEYYFKNGDLLNEYKVNMPVGTGCYKYLGVDDNIIKFGRNNSWWNKTENDRLDFIYLYKYDSYGEAIKAYKSSDVDLIITTMSDWEKKFGTIGNNIYRFESSIYDMIVPNFEKKFLKEASVRKAILYAINRQVIVSEAFNSNASIVDLPVHNYSTNYKSDLQTNYDLDKARQILINASWQYNDGVWTKDNATLKFTLLVNEENAEQMIVAEIIKESLGDFGIPITIKKQSWSKFKDALQSGNFDLALTSIDLKNDVSILELIETKNKFNYANYSNSSIDELISELKINYENAKVKSLYDLWKEEVPYIGLFFRSNTLLTNKSVKGTIEPHWANFYGGINTWCK